MRIFVLGVGGAGSLLAQLLVRQGHTVWCGDRDPDRARKFLGKKSTIEVVEANARNLWSIVRAARGCNLLVNASPAVFNEIILRAALRLRVHYLDLNSHLNRNPFKPEQFRFQKRFAAKNRTALICTGAAPGLTNLLAKRGSELLDTVESIQIRLYESTESKDPVSTWSPEVMYDEAISSPRIYRHGRFSLAKRFAEREKFRFPPPIGETTVYLAAQDEVCMLPYVIPMRDMRRENRRQRFRSLVSLVPPRPPEPLAGNRAQALSKNSHAQRSRWNDSPRRAGKCALRRGRADSRVKDDQPLLLRYDASFPTLYQIRQRGLISTPIAYATAHLAAIFIKHFPRDMGGVFGPSELPMETRRAILAEARSRDFRVAFKMTRLKKIEDDEY